MTAPDGCLPWSRYRPHTRKVKSQTPSNIMLVIAWGYICSQGDGSALIGAITSPIRRAEPGNGAAFFLGLVPVLILTTVRSSIPASRTRSPTIEQT